MKTFKKLTALIMALTLSTFMLAACGSDDSASDGDKKSDGADSKKTLKVAMEIGYPPFEYYGDDGVTPTGIDVELSYALGKELGMDVELINTAWDGIFAGLAKKDYDCVISAVTITKERLLDFSFTTPYIENWQCIVTLKDAKNKPDSVDKLAGLKVCYQESTTSDDYLTEYFANAESKPEVFEYAQVLDCFNELKLGRVDAVICDSTVAQKFLEEGIYETTWNQDKEEGAVAEQFGVCCRKGDSEMVEKLNAALVKLKENGKLQEILDKYF